jgi:hypothetical protein
MYVDRAPCSTATPKIMARGEIDGCGVLDVLAKTVTRVPPHPWPRGSAGWWGWLVGHHALALDADEVLHADAWVSACMVVPLVPPAAVMGPLRSSATSVSVGHLWMPAPWERLCGRPGDCVVDRAVGCVAPVLWAVCVPVARMQYMPGMPSGSVIGVRSSWWWWRCWRWSAWPESTGNGSGHTVPCRAASLARRPARSASWPRWVYPAAASARVPGVGYRHLCSSSGCGGPSTTSKHKSLEARSVGEDGVRVIRTAAPSAHIR